MPHAHRRAPVLVQDAARGALDVGPEVRGGRQVEVDAEAVFDPGVLAVRLKDRTVAARHLQVAQELMDGRNARMDAAHFVRALHAEGHACTAEQAVRIVKLIVRAVAELKAIGIDKRVRGLDLRLDVEEARDVEAPTDLAREAQRHVVHRTLLAAVNRHFQRGNV